MAGGKQIELAEDFEDLFKSLADDGKFGGVYLARPTGKLLEEDNTFIEVMLANKSFYAKPCFSFGSWNAPNKEWLEKYKNEIMVWVAYENGNSGHAVYLGIMPLNKKVPNFSYLRGKNWKSTEFKYYFDDAKKEFKLDKVKADGSVHKSVFIDDTFVKVTDSKGNKLILNSETGQVEFKNWKGFGLKTTNTFAILGNGAGAEALIKGTTHIPKIQAILTQLATTPMVVNPLTMTASFDPATISALNTAIGALSQDLSNKAKID